MHSFACVTLADPNGSCVRRSCQKSELLGRGLLFGRDFKAHSEAAELLAACLPAEAPAVVACLDLLLTWICARICDANMSCLLKVLALTRSLLLQLREQVQTLALPVCMRE